MKKQREQLRTGSYAQTRRVLRVQGLANLPDAPPRFIPPMQCKLVDRLPVGKQWSFELKLDGYRALAIKADGGVKLISRNKKELSSHFPEIVEGIRCLRHGAADHCHQRARFAHEQGSIVRKSFVVAQRDGQC